MTAPPAYCLLSYLWRVGINAVAFVVNVAQLLLQVQLDPVVEANDSATASCLAHKHMLET